MVLWRISTQTKKYKADDISGTGAQKVGGRWNQVGTPMLYCAQNISLACLETIAHLNADLLWLDRYLIRIDVPIGLGKQFVFPKHSDLPAHWHANPYEEMTSRYGTEWVNQGKSLGIILPSSIIHEENIVCLNPRHPRYFEVKATVVRKWQYDERIVRI
jgi:RES domain-containing protein